MHCLLHVTFQSLSIRLQFLLWPVLFLCVTWLYIWDGVKWLVSFLSLGTVWLTLPTFCSPVALSKCWSSRGNILVCSPGPSLPTLASGYSHYPLASPLPPPQTLCPPIPWQLAWLMLLTADPPPHTHTLSSPSFRVFSLHGLKNKIWTIRINIWMSVCVLVFFFSVSVHGTSHCVLLS